MRYRLLLAVAVSVATVDALTKAAAVVASRWMPASLPGGWALRVAHNNGAFLGIGTGTGLPTVFGLAAAVLFAGLLWLTRHRRGPLWAVALGLIAGGAGANQGEYQIFGYVVDWIAPPHPPIVFDLADVAVFGGQLLLVILLVSELCRVRTRAAVTQ